jgi:hypothetical protein
VRDLDSCWEELSQHAELPVLLRNKITKIKESSLDDIDSVHSLIRFLHEAGNRALEKEMASAQADITFRTFAWSPCKANILIIKADLPAMIAKSPSSGPIAQEFDFANAVFMQFLRQVGKHEYGGFVARYANNHSIGCA